MSMVDLCVLLLVSSFIFCCVNEVFFFYDSLLLYVMLAGDTILGYLFCLYLGAMFVICMCFITGDYFMFSSTDEGVCLTDTVLMGYLFYHRYMGADMFTNAFFF